MCTTDSGVCTPSQLVEHGTKHDTTIAIGSILSTSVSTRRTMWSHMFGVLSYAVLNVNKEGNRHSLVIT